MICSLRGAGELKDIKWRHVKEYYDETVDKDVIEIEIANSKTGNCSINKLQPTERKILKVFKTRDAFCMFDVFCSFRSYYDGTDKFWV